MRINKTLLIGLVLLLGINMILALDGYSRYVDINITETSATSLTDYSVLLNISYDSDMQADFDEIIFTTTDNTTLIDFYIEEYNSGVNALVWVQLPSLTASSTETVRMWYGNSTATTSSNFNTAFVYADDFNTNTSERYSYTGAILSNEVTDGYMNITCDGAGLCFITPNSTYQYISTNYTVEVYSAGYDASGYIGVYGYGNANPIIQSDDYYGSAWGQFGTDFYIYTTNWGQLYFENIPAGQGIFRKYKINLMDNLQNVTTTFGSRSTTDTLITNGTYGILNYNGLISTDWFRVYPTTTSEPTYTFGTEQSTLSGNAPVVTLVSPANNSVSTDLEVDFECYAMLDPTNISLYIDGVYDVSYTNLTGNATLYVQTSESLTVGDHNWSCVAENQYGSTQSDTWFFTLEEPTCSTIPANNYTITGGVIIANSGSPYLGENVNVTYDYLYQTSGLVGQVVDDTGEALAGTTSWFGVIIIITIMVVLVILTVLIISAVKRPEISTA